MEPKIASSNRQRKGRSILIKIITSSIDIDVLFLLPLFYLDKDKLD